MNELEAKANGTTLVWLSRRDARLLSRLAKYKEAVVQVMPQIFTERYGKVVQFTCNLDASHLSVDFTGFITGDYRIDWGDGSEVEENGVTHTYASAKEYVIGISSDTGVTINQWPSALRTALTKIAIPGESPIIGFKEASSSTNGIFSTCSKLTTIPENLFSALTVDGTKLAYMFYLCSSLTAIPEGLLSTLPTGITSLDLTYLFAACSRLTAIPDKLLSTLPTGITSLTLRYMFGSCTALTAIPEGLLSTLPTGITSLNLKDMFNSGISLTAIPDKLLSTLPTGITSLTLTWMFGTCSKLTAIPDKLLSTLPIGITSLDLTYMFYYCTRLTAIPEGLLSTLPSGLTTLGLACMFQSCTGITSAIPEWWNEEKLQSSNHAGCFGDCTKATNYQDIPKGWGGPTTAS